MKGWGGRLFFAVALTDLLKLCVLFPPSLDPGRCYWTLVLVFGPGSAATGAASAAGWVVVNTLH